MDGVPPQMETTSWVFPCMHFPAAAAAAWKETLRKRKANRMHVRHGCPVSSGFGTGPEHDQLIASAGKDVDLGSACENSCEAPTTTSSGPC